MNAINKMVEELMEWRKREPLGTMPEGLAKMIAEYHDVKGRIEWEAEFSKILSRFTPVPDDGGLKERVAQITAHRACHNQEQDLPNGKVAGYCIVCGVPWPCQYSGPHPAQENKEMK